MTAEDIAEQVRQVRSRIDRAARRVGRDPADVRLVAVTKSVDVDRMRAAIAAGVSILGENRLQEALPKLEQIGKPPGLSWHFIGRLQRRKVKAVVGAFEMIQSVDSIELAAEIDRRASAAGLRQPVLIEVNLAGESSKAGLAPDEVLDAMAKLDSMASLQVRGLMAIPPAAAHPESVRPHFRLLRELADSIGSSAPSRWRHIEMQELSMGMSGDFEIAVEEGATLVRIGTAIFGARIA